jgi:hypothetical protein
MAIRRNTDSEGKMKQDVWAIYFHKISTDSEPHHGLCPKGETSCCKCNHAIVTGENIATNIHCQCYKTSIQKSVRYKPTA